LGRAPVSKLTPHEGVTAAKEELGSRRAVGVHTGGHVKVLVEHDVRDGASGGAEVVDGEYATSSLLRGRLDVAQVIAVYNDPDRIMQPGGSWVEHLRAERSVATRP